MVECSCGKSSLSHHIQDALRITSREQSFSLVMKSSNGNGMKNNSSKLVSEAISEMVQETPSPSRPKTVNPMAVERPSKKSSPVTVSEEKGFEANFRLKIDPSAFFIGVEASSNSFDAHSQVSADYSMQKKEDSIFKYRPKLNAKFDNRLIVQQIELFKFMIIALINPTFEFGIDLGTKIPAEMEMMLKEMIETIKIKGVEDTKKLKAVSDWSLKKMKELRDRKKIEKVEVEVLKDASQK